jgi:hypothetical protein
VSFEKSRNGSSHFFEPNYCTGFLARATMEADGLRAIALLNIAVTEQLGEFPKAFLSG